MIRFFKKHSISDSMSSVLLSHAHPQSLETIASFLNVIVISNSLSFYFDHHSW